MAETTTTTEPKPGPKPPEKEPEVQSRTLTEIKRAPIVVRNEVQLFDTGRFEHMQRIATAMADAKLVPKHFWGSRSDCLMVVEQATRWRMSPFAVAQKTYVVDGKLAYEAQLVAAVVNSSDILQGRLTHAYSGSGGDLVCTVSGKLRGEDVIRVKSSPKVRDIKVKNSPLWTVDPEQQLLYWTQRAWARAHCSDVLLGVYTPDEFDADDPDYARDVTPAPPQPTREQFVDKPKEATDQDAGQKPTEDEPAEDQGFAVVDTDGEIVWSGGDVRHFCNMFLSRLTSVLSPKQIEGIWDTNSSQLSRVPPEMSEEVRRAYGKALEKHGWKPQPRTEG